MSKIISSFHSLPPSLLLHNSLGNSIYVATYPSFPTRISSSVLSLFISHFWLFPGYLPTYSEYLLVSLYSYSYRHHHLLLVLRKEKRKKKKKKHKQSRKNQPEIDMKLFSLFRLNATCITLKKGIMRTQTPNHHRLYSSAWSRIHLIPSSRNVSGSTKASAETFASQTIFSGLSRLYWGHAGALSGHDTS